VNLNSNAGLCTQCRRARSRNLCLCRAMIGAHMPPGTKLGPYEIVAPIGAGGMVKCTRRAIPGWGVMSRSKSRQTNQRSVRARSTRGCKFSRQSERESALASYGLMATLAAIALWAPWRAPAPEQQSMRFEIYPPDKTTFAGQVDDPPLIQGIERSAARWSGPDP
jgi:hypothetical protein